MSGVSEQAEALAEVLWPRTVHLTAFNHGMAQRAVDAGWVHRDSLVAEGWTPPPDPWETIARAIHNEHFGTGCTGTCLAHSNIYAAVRRLMTADEAQAIAGRIEGEP